MQRRLLSQGGSTDSCLYALKQECSTLPTTGQVWGLQISGRQQMTAVNINRLHCCRRSAHTSSKSRPFRLFFVHSHSLVTPGYILVAVAAFPARSDLFLKLRPPHALLNPADPSAATSMDAAKPKGRKRATRKQDTAPAPTPAQTVADPEKLTALPESDAQPQQPRPSLSQRITRSLQQLGGASKAEVRRRCQPHRCPCSRPSSRTCSPA